MRPSRSLLHIALICVLTLGVASACSDDTEYSGDGSSSGSTDFSNVSLDTLSSDTARALCAQVNMGCPGIDSDLLIFAGSDDCVATLTEIYENEVIPDTLASIESGRQVFDTTAAQDCFERLATTCVDLNTDEVCNRIFTGTVAEGGFCEEGLDCAGDSYCTFNSSDVCAQSCQPAKAVGESCSNDDECSQGTAAQIGVCVYDNTFDGACRLLDRADGGAEGDVCNVDAAQNQYVTCAAGLVCNDDNDGFNDNGRCQAPIALGEPCSDFDACAGQAICALGTCRAFEIANQAGDACTSGEIGDTFVICNALQDLICDGGTCRQVNPGAEGEPCTEGTFNSCQPGLTCEYTENDEEICQPLAANGEACDWEYDCASQACQDGVCVEQLSCP